MNQITQFMKRFRLGLFPSYLKLKLRAKKLNLGSKTNRDFSHGSSTDYLGLDVITQSFNEMLIDILILIKRNAEIKLKRLQQNFLLYKKEFYANLCSFIEITSNLDRSSSIKQENYKKTFLTKGISIDKNIKFKVIRKKYIFLLLLLAQAINA